MKRFLLVAVMCVCGFLSYAQKPKGTYADHKKQITESYRKQMQAISGDRQLSVAEKKRQRDAAIDRYMSAKKANRAAYRRKVSNEPNPLAQRKRFS